MIFFLQFILHIVVVDVVMLPEFLYETISSLTSLEKSEKNEWSSMIRFYFTKLAGDG